MHVFASRGIWWLCEQDAHTGGMELSSSAVLSGIAFHRVAARPGPADRAAGGARAHPGPYGMAVVGPGDR
jgi:hypothetical protein